MSGALVEDVVGTKIRAGRVRITRRALGDRCSHGELKRFERTGAQLAVYCSVKHGHHPASDEIRGLLERVDAICREAETLRVYAEAAMRRPPLWPSGDWSARSTDDVRHECGSEAA